MGVGTVLSRSCDYRQCTLQKLRPGGGTQTVTYLPADCAVLGKCVSLRDKPGGDKWTPGWKVIRVDKHVQTSEQVRQLSRLYLNQRKASDI
jgi:hypothetical protein